MKGELNKMASQKKTDTTFSRMPDSREFGREVKWLDSMLKGISFSQDIFRNTFAGMVPCYIIPGKTTSSVTYSTAGVHEGRVILHVEVHSEGDDEVNPVLQENLKKLGYERK